MRRSSKDPLNLGNVKMHARFEALDVVGFVAGVRYALRMIESGKAQVTIKLALCKKCKCECSQVTASDPTPELRERIARVLYAQDSDAGPFFYAQEYADGVDAVLAALKAEPK